MASYEAEADDSDERGEGSSGDATEHLTLDPPAPEPDVLGGHLLNRII